MEKDGGENIFGSGKNEGRSDTNKKDPSLYADHIIWDLFIFNLPIATL